MRKFFGQRYQSNDNSAPLVFAVLFCMLLQLGVWQGVMSWWWQVLYGLTSVATFIIYLFDKHAARLQRRRIRESTLHLLALCGGWPGALLAQRWIRHKSRKASFQLRFWLTVLLNCAALAGFVWLAGSGERVAWL